MDLEKVYNFSKNILENDATGHDWKHALRVEKNALAISPTSLSKNKMNIIKVSCWLHDTIDPKISNTKQVQLEDLDRLLKSANATTNQIKKILYIIQNLSYSKNIDQKQELDLLGKIVQDADRLDAIGAIGIARAFYYGGSKKHLLYDSNPPRAKEEITEENYRNQESVVNHFYEKLLTLENSMNTEKAKKIAKGRTKIMEVFLDDFFDEIGY